MRKQRTRTKIETPEQFKAFIKDIYKCELVTLDTETTGLHIIKDAAFMCQISTKENSWLFYFADMNPIFLRKIQEVLETVGTLVLANAKFDMHMCRNAGMDLFNCNIGDVLVLASITINPDNIEIKSKSLKELSAKFIDPKAKTMMGVVDSYYTGLESITKLERSEWLKANGVKLTYDGLVKFIKNPANYATKLYDERYEALMKSHKLFPDPTYEDVDPNILEEYGYLDSELTYDLYEFMYELMMRKHNLETYKLEMSILKPIYKTEMLGFRIDLEYLEESLGLVANDYKNTLNRIRETMIDDMWLKHKEVLNSFEIYRDQQHFHTPVFLKNLIKTNKLNIHIQVLKDYSDYLFNTLVAQPTLMLRYFQMIGNDIESVGKEVLNRLVVDPQVDDKTKNFIGLLKHGRTLVKWYATYLLKYKNNAIGDRYYTQIAQCKAKTGRMSSDFHQFPKAGLKNLDDELIFKPRKLIKVNDNAAAIYYFDYSQIELRIQADYTMRWFDGDLNLVRAYLPFQCTYKNGKYYLNENPEEEWTPTDLHSLTTSMAFPNLDPKSKEFKEKRSLGKTTNFAKNYGGGYSALAKQFGHLVGNEVVEMLNNSYGVAYPKVKQYGEKIYTDLLECGRVQTLYGRKFYGSRTSYFNKYNNYVIQGSGADLLKTTLANLYRFLNEVGLKSEMQMFIHDEISLLVYEEEKPIIEKYVKSIMELNTHGMIVPIVCDVEITNTNWAEKEDLDVDNYKAQASDAWDKLDEIIADAKRFKEGL